MARMSVNQAPIGRAALLEALRLAGMSGKALAVASGANESAIADGINRRNGRSFDIDWLFNTDPALRPVIALFLRQVERVLELTPETKAEIDADRIAELLRLLLRRSA